MPPQPTPEPSEIVLSTLLTSATERKSLLSGGNLKGDLFPEKWQELLFIRIQKLHKANSDFTVDDLHARIVTDKQFTDEANPNKVYDLNRQYKPGEVKRALDTLKVQIVRRKMANDLEKLDHCIDMGDPVDDIARRISGTALKLADTGSENRLDIVCIADVVPQKVDWLWRNTVPRGMVTILDGDPGLGKSTLAVYMAAQVSRGLPCYADTETREPRNVILISSEDNVSCSLRPRLEAAGADLKRVLYINPISDKGDYHRLYFPEGLPLLQSMIEKFKPALIVLDTLVDLVSPTISTHVDQEIRRVMSALSSLANSVGTAIICVRHLNKSSGQSALQRGGGSIGIIGSARQGLLVAKDPDDPNGVIMAVNKSNVGPKARSRKFSLKIHQKLEVASIEWHGEVDYSADDLVSDDRKGTSPADIAVDFLKNLLRDGRVSSIEVLEGAKASGISKRALTDAQSKLGIKPQKEGNPASWYWELGQDDQDDHFKR